MNNEQEIWRPNPGPQTKALQSSAFETLYGGARGGGKTDAGIVWLLKEITNPRLRGLVIRKNSDDLSDWVDRAIHWYQRYGAVVTGKPAIIRFPSGAIIRSGHLKDDQAYTKYQGHEYQRMLLEEVTQIPDETRYLQLLGSCRSTVKGLDARVFLTTNPGGVGHAWVKRRFVEAAIPGEKFQDPATGRTRVFIPAKVEDTPQLVQNDPGYVNFLEGLKQTNVELWKAWRLGDWNTFAGQYFAEFRHDLHVITPFVPAKSSVIIGGMDWGRANPFAFHLSTVEKVFYQNLNDTQSFYRVKTFFEVYGTEKNPMEWSRTIKDDLFKKFRLTLEDITWVRCDPTIFNKGNDNSESIQTQFANDDLKWRLLKPANNDRIPGWAIMHNWLSLAPDNMPYWQIASNCINLIRTLPIQIHDAIHVEDIDSDGEDHSADATRYMLKHLKWVEGKTGQIRNKDDRKAKFTGMFSGSNEDMGKHLINPAKFK